MPAWDWDWEPGKRVHVGCWKSQNPRVGWDRVDHATRRLPSRRRRHHAWTGSPDRSCGCEAASGGQPVHLVARLAGPVTSFASHLTFILTAQVHSTKARSFKSWYGSMVLLGVFFPTFVFISPNHVAHVGTRVSPNFVVASSWLWVPDTTTTCISRPCDPFQRPPSQTSTVA